MSRFADNATRIFEAAESASLSGGQVSEMTILLSRTGGIRMIADSDWPLESLRRHHGAEMAFRVREDRAGFAVEGRSRSRRCELRGEKPAWAARQILGTGFGSGWQPPLLIAGE